MFSSLVPRLCVLIVATTCSLAAQPADVVPLGHGFGSGATAPRLTATAPLLGKTVTFNATDLTANAAGALLIADPRRGPWPVGGTAAAFVDFAAIRAAIPVRADGAGVLTVNVGVPNVGALLGFTGVVQSFVASANALGADVTDGVKLTIGDRVTPSVGPLTGLPSAGGAHLAALQSLGDDAWLDLGVPAADPTYGLATGRGYTPRLAPADHLGGAFFTGEGRHGYVIPTTNRYVDDVWFYDLNAHRWICVKPGSHTPTLNLRLNPDRFEVDANNDVIPVAQLGHGYELVTYDEDRRAFLMLAAPNTYWQNAMPQRVSWLGSPSLPASQSASPWLFETATGKWRRKPPGSPRPSFNVAGRGMIAHYVERERAVWCWDSNSPRMVWYFDSTGYTWRNLFLPDGPAVAGNGVSCIDRERGRIYYFAVDAARTAFRLWYYDVASAEWVDTQATGMPALAGRSIYVSSYGGLTFDETSRKVVVRLPQSGHYYPSFYAFDPATGAFEASPRVPPTAFQPLFRWGSVNAFYARDLNAHVFHIASEGNSTGRFLAYRLAR